jgi:hypothetical protein
MEVRDMFQPNPEEAPVLSVTQTPGLASADQLVDVTENELFSFQQSTSETGEFQIVFLPFHRSEEAGPPRAVQDQAPAVPFERLRVKVITEDDGRVTIYSAQLDIASFGRTKSEARERFLAALDDLRRFYLENKSTLSRPLLEKLQILESPLDIVEME